MAGTCGHLWRGAGSGASFAGPSSVGPYGQNDRSCCTLSELTHSGAGKLLPCNELPGHGPSRNSRGLALGRVLTGEGGPATGAGPTPAVGVEACLTHRIRVGPAS